MSVEDWARRKAVSRMDIAPDMTPAEASEFSWGIVHAFSALLSDEAVEAAVRRIAIAQGNTWKVEPGWSVPAVSMRQMREVLQAAIAAVTERDAVTIKVPAEVADQVERGYVGGFSIAEGDTE